MLKDRVRLVTVFLVLALMGLLAVLWFAILSPRLSVAEGIEMQSADVELANLSLLKKQRDFLDLAEQAPQAAADAQVLFSKMPQSADLPSLLNQVSEAAISSGISPNNIKVINASIPVSTADVPNEQDSTSQEAIGVQLATLTLDMTVDGSNSDLLDFVDNLQDLDRALLLTSTNLVDLPAEEDQGQQTLTISATLFVLESRLPDLVSNAQSVIDRAREQALAPSSTNS